MVTTTPQLPPGPTDNPWIQTFQWLQDPIAFMENCQQKYGDLFTVNVGPVFKPQVFISNPSAIQSVFATDPKFLDSGAAAGISSPMLGEQSLLTIEGEPHRKQRRLLTPPLHGERMQAYGQLICKITQAATQDWETGTPFTARPVMQQISFQVILKAVFGLEEGARSQQLQARLLGQLNPQRPLIQGLIFLFPLFRKDWGPWSPWGQFMQRLQAIDELIYAEIRERRSHPDPARNDILSLMMAARDEDGEAMSDVELRDELMTLLIAGHETTATSLSWALYWIHYLPEVREKLLAELSSLGEHPDLSAIARLPYLNAVCQETLRIYPVAMLALNRIVKQPLEIAGHHFEPGTLLVPCVYLTHRREDLYPDSHQFRPERFLERSFTPAEYLPFGGGNRRCIGMAFALYEMKLVLATLLSQWQIALAKHEPIRAVRVGALLRPETGVNLVVQGQRSHPPQLTPEPSFSSS